MTTISSNPTQYLLLDFATTGLDTRCGILAAAFATLDGYLEPTSNTGSCYVRPHAGCLVEAQAMEMHERRGLTEEYRQHAHTLMTYGDLERGLLTSVQGVDVPMLVGNGSAFDRGFIAAHMPTLHARLAGPMLDVSSMRKLAQVALEFAKPWDVTNGLGLKTFTPTMEVQAAVVELAAYVNMARGGLKSPKTDVVKLAHLQALAGR